MGEAYDIDAKYKAILQNELKFERVEGVMFAFVHERQRCTMLQCGMHSNQIRMRIE